MITTRKLFLNPGDTLRVSGAAEIQATAHFIDVAPGSPSGVPNSSVLELVDAASTVLVASPTTSVVRVVGEVSLYNPTASAVSVLVMLTRGGNDYIVARHSLAAGASTFI